MRRTPLVDLTGSDEGDVDVVETAPKRRVGDGQAMDGDNRARKRNAREDAVVLAEDEEDDDVVFEGAVVRARAPPPPPVRQATLGEMVGGSRGMCRYGSKCNRKHRCPFQHPAEHQYGRLPSIGGGYDYQMMRSMFGSEERYHHHLQEQERRRQEEERALKEAITKSIADEAEAKDRRRVRKNQDIEYLQSLRKDKEREEEMALREEEEKLRQEKAKAEAEEALQLELAKQASLKDAFEDEPTEGCQVTLHFPSGERITRRFASLDAVSRIRDFVEFSRAAREVPEQFDLVQLPRNVLANDVSVSALGARCLIFILASSRDEN